jgi:hypothetical protein
VEVVHGHPGGAGRHRDELPVGRPVDLVDLAAAFDEGVVQAPLQPRKNLRSSREYLQHEREQSQDDHDSYDDNQYIKNTGGELDAGRRSKCVGLIYLAGETWWPSWEPKGRIHQDLSI